MNEQDMKERIAKLEAENRALKKGRAPAANKAPKFPFVAEYDVTSMVSVADIIEHCQPPAHIEKLSEGDVRSLLRLFSVDGVAQHKTEGEKGRGTLLYSRERIDSILDSLDA
jgi:hypothetical protein